MDSLINKFKNHFKGTVNICANKDGIRIGDSQTGVYLNLSFKSLLKEFTEYDGDIKKLESSLKGDWEIRKLFHFISETDIFEQDNHKLTLYGKQHNSFKDRWVQGFYKDRYSEFIIELNNSFLDGHDVNDSELMTNFKIGLVKVKISLPSLIFKMVFSGINPHLSDNDWKDYVTISFQGLSQKDVNLYLQQALFLLDKYNADYFILGYSHVPHCPNACKIINTPAKEFPIAKYIDALCLYNEATNATAETCFYYFYRVIEYFFPVNQENELLEEINSFNKNLNTNELINRLKLLCSQDEETNLKNLFNGVGIKDEISHLAELYISDDDKNNCKNINNKFAERLYKYRNRVVHSKESTRRIPNILDSNNEIDEWNEIVQEVSKICIKYFCYENKLTDSFHQPDKE